MSRYVMMFLIALAYASSAKALDLSEFKITCSEIGFEAGTEAHGNCVLTLVRREREKKQAAAAEQNTISKNQRAAQELENQRTNQQMLAIQQQQLKLQQEALQEAKRQRSIRALGLAKQGLDLAFPNSGSSSSSSQNKNVWCGNYGLNTLCSAN